MNVSLAAAAVTALIALAPRADAAVPADVDALHELYRQRLQWSIREFPEWAFRRGVERAAGRTTDASIEAIRRRHRDTVSHLGGLRAIGAGGLRGDELVNYELFERMLADDVDGHRFQMYLAPLTARQGPHIAIPQLADTLPFERAPDYEHYFRLLAAVPTTIAQHIERMQLGVAAGITPPAIVMQGVPARIEALLGEGGLAPLAAPFRSFPEDFDESQRDTFAGRWRFEAEPPVRQALTDLHRFLVDEYLPGCRTSIAAADLPRGKMFYAHELRRMTTTELTAKKIHELGLAEVARVRAEMMDVIRRSDFVLVRSDAGNLEDDELFAAFVEYLRTDERFYFDDPEALLTGYRDICKRVDAHLPAFFHTLPRLPYGVRAIPAFMAPQQTTAYYQHGSQERGEPGWFYANTYELDQRPRYEMIALAMHEAVPGHHFQVALAQELGDVPDFRHDLWFTAFGEGWALYSERLGIEMGLYEDPYDDFGRLLYEMWRACRLVVDPGIHRMGWTREQAIEFLMANTALSELNITNEIDRYIAWPGQACAYKIGELRIRELRHKAEDRLGAGFDLRAFHDVVLGAGSVPLDVLERRVNEWMRRSPAGMAYD